MNKLYIIVRNDIAPGLQLAQSCHATEQFHRDHPTLASAWLNIVCLQVPSKEKLADLAYRAVTEGFAASLFREPDLDDEPTAVAVAGDAQKLFSSLPLALRPAQAA